ncbi:MAG: chemotaxis protein CheW [Bacteroidetes bacterium]|nr:MAG: chemotaxis protein CheW [Bacteroidota bacterium]
MAEEINTDLRTYLSFTLGGEEFALDVQNVIKILQMQHFTKIPQSPEYLKGIINIRGNVIPVVDTYYKFGFNPLENESNSVIIILNLSIRGEDSNVGIMADKANEVFEAATSSIQDYPSLAEKYNSNFITGVYKKQETFILILDIEKIFSSEDIAELKNIG